MTDFMLPAERLSALTETVAAPHWYARRVMGEAMSPRGDIGAGVAIFSEA